MGEDHRDVDALLLGTGLDPDVDAGAVFLGSDVYVSRSIAAGELAVSTEVISANGHLVQVSDLFYKPLLNRI